jgi:hypothetical protein
MKSVLQSTFIRTFAALAGLSACVAPVFAADFTVATPGNQFAFQINGVNSPNLTLVRGRTYTFSVGTSVGFHPFHIESPGVSNNNIDTGTMTYAVPTVASNYYYNCVVHGDLMRGEITTVPPPDFAVRTPGSQFSFQINGVNGPTLTLVRGQTYTFDVQTTVSFHPFHIESTGVTSNNIDTGTMTYTVPTANSNYFYNCVVHGDLMRGEIVTVPPPTPVIQILSLEVNSNLVVTSTGTNGWTVNPEYSTNLATTNWFALTVQTNRFFTGTNETVCGKPPGSPIFIRVRSQPN